MLDVVQSLDSLTDLFDSVKDGHIRVVERIVETEITVQTFLNLASTLLHLAANHRHTNILQYLLEHRQKLFVDCLDANKTTALMVAAKNGDDASVQLLLKHSANVNAEDYDSRTPLYFAAYDGHIECVYSILMNEDINLSIVRKGGWTPLHEAARFGHVEVVEALIRHGMDIMATTDDAAWTPGHMAASSGRLECLQVLINAGIDVNKGAGPYRLSTLLHEACHRGHNGCIRLLLESGADPLLHDGVDLPHHLACKYDQAESLELLLTHAKEHNMKDYIDLYTYAAMDSTDYNNALHMAAYYGRKDCLEVLLRHNAKNTLNGVERTPEILTIFKLHVDCLKLLLSDMKSKGELISERREEKEKNLNPLYYLCRNAYKTNEKTVACGCILLNSGLVDVNSDYFNSNCLDAAVQNGSIPLVRALLLAGADPQMCRVNKGFTENANVEMCLDFVDEALTEPKSLLHCCRIKIRELLKYNVGVEFVYQLPLPRMLMNYVYHGHYNVRGLCDL